MDDFWSVRKILHFKIAKRSKGAFKYIWAHFELFVFEKTDNHKMECTHNNEFATIFGSFFDRQRATGSIIKMFYCK